MLFKYHFILKNIKQKKERKEKTITWVLFVHKAFWKLHLTIHFCSPVAVLELSWKWTLFVANDNKIFVDGCWGLFSPDAQLCYPKHRRTLMADCGMKVNVRIKTDILSDFVFILFFDCCILWHFLWPFCGFLSYIRVYGNLRSAELKT